jgi:DUF438 domain-containing protein
LVSRYHNLESRSNRCARSATPSTPSTAAISSCWAGSIKIAAELVRLIEHDTGRHFDFEERELLPRLAEAGEADIAELLRQEHDSIRAVAAEILPLARAAAAGTLGEEGFERFKRDALELVERQVSHIQKETMALLPMLDDLLDDETDRELSFSYAAG